MRMRFIVIFIVAMLLILISSILFTYRAVNKTQQTINKELIIPLENKLNNNNEANKEAKKTIAIYKAFSKKNTVKITRETIAMFLVELLIMAGLFLLFIFEVTRPLKKLSLNVNKICFGEKIEITTIKEEGSNEVRTLIQAFNSMLQKLGQYEELIGDTARYRGWKEISRVIVHEVNNLISPVQTYSEYLLDQVDDNSKILLILNKLQEIKGVLQKFRNMSHLPEAVLENENVFLLVCDVVKEFKKVRITCDDENIVLPLDEVLFKEILRNLIKNGLEATGLESSRLEATSTTTTHKAKVKVQIITINTKTTISISDNGSGIEKSKLNKIFAPGYTNKPGNIGIGLSIVRSLTQAHNATISVDSEVGKGTVFKIVFGSQLR